MPLRVACCYRSDLMKMKMNKRRSIRSNNWLDALELSGEYVSSDNGSCSSNEESNDNEFDHEGSADEGEEDFDIDNNVLELLEDSRIEFTLNDYVNDGTGLFSVSEMEELK